MATARKPTRKQRRAQARAKRLERERAEVAARRRRLRARQAGATATVAALAVGIAIAIFGASGGDGGLEPSEAPAGAAETAALFRGVPQDGTALGRPDAPVTMVEFADLQCPFCRDYATATLPGLVDLLADAEGEASAAGIDSTPSSVVGRTRGALERFQPQSLDAGPFRGELDRLLSER